MEMTEAIAKKVLETVDKGLSSGLGTPSPGHMCVEAAVCYAMGMPHGDKPSCVGDAVRAYKIRLNDATWLSKSDRAKGMRRVAIAQLGSDKIEQIAFSKEVLLQVTKQLLPIALRAAGSINPKHKDSLKSAAIACEAIIEFGQIKAAANAAYAAADAAAYVADAAAYAAAYAAYAAANAADAVAYAANAAAYAAYAADAAASAANAANDAANAAYAAAYAADAADVKNNILSKAAEIGVQALIKFGAQGCTWLDLTEGAK